jgi:hypothetical protein
MMKITKIAITMVALAMGFAACSEEKKDETTNPFVGTWTQDGSNGKVTAVLTEETWTAKVESSVYNSGTYTFEGNTAQWTVTNKGIGSAEVGDGGAATISDGKMAVSNFADANMNGTYSKP